MNHVIPCRDCELPPWRCRCAELTQAPPLTWESLLAFAARKAELRADIHRRHVEMGALRKRQRRLDTGSAPTLAARQKAAALEVEIHRLNAQAEALWSEWFALELGRQVEVFDWSEYLSKGVPLPAARRANYAGAPEVE